MTQVTVETCDDGNQITETCVYGDEFCRICNRDCQEIEGQTSFCGDGFVDQAQGENCDDRNQVTESCAYGQESCTVCNAQCREVAGSTSRCGDGVVDETAGETCDDRNQVTEACAYGQESCRVCNAIAKEVDGQTSRCGDGFIDGFHRNFDQTLMHRMVKPAETCDDRVCNAQNGHLLWRQLYRPYGQASCTGL